MIMNGPEEQYETTMSILVSYYYFGQSIIKRVNNKENSFRIKYLFLPSAKGFDPWLANKISSIFRNKPNIEQIIDHANEEERNEIFFKIFTSKHQNDELSKYILNEVKNINIAQIKNIQELNKSNLEWLNKINLRLLLTAILGVSVFFLNSLPHSLIKLLGPDRENPALEKIGGLVGLYEITVFFYTVSSIIIILILWFFWFFYFRRDQLELSRFIDFQIKYLSIYSETTIAQSGKGEDLPPLPNT
jgi:hypothetical protein